VGAAEAMKAALRELMNMYVCVWSLGGGVCVLCEDSRTCMRDVCVCVVVCCACMCSAKTHEPVCVCVCACV
jgi:hypothetical protein